MKLRIYDQFASNHYGGSSDLLTIRINKEEDEYDSKFVFIHAINPTKSYWSTDFYYIFVRNKPKDGETKYFGLKDLDSVFETPFDAPEMDDLIIRGVIANDGEIIYSSFRHDYVQSTDGSVVIDGGRDYMRSGIGSPVSYLHLDGDKLSVFDDMEFIYGLDEEPHQDLKMGSAQEIFQRHVRGLLDSGMIMSEIVTGIQCHRPYQGVQIPIPWVDLNVLRINSLPEKTNLKELKTWMEKNCDRHDYLWVGNCIYLSNDSIAVQIKLRFG